MHDFIHTLVKLVVASLIVGTIMSHFGVTAEKLIGAFGLTPETALGGVGGGLVRRWRAFVACEAQPERSGVACELTRATASAAGRQARVTAPGPRGFPKGFEVLDFEVCFKASRPPREACRPGEKAACVKPSSG